MLIGLAGAARAGKDTIGGIICTEYGFKRIAFADVMKAFALAVDPIVGFFDTRDGGVPMRLSTVVERRGWDKAKENPEIRQLLQRIGTEGGRNLFGENFWVENTFRALDTANEDWVVTDVRFQNEFTAVKERGGLMAYVSRHGVEAANGHRSEHDLDGYTFDRIIRNDVHWADLNKLVADTFPELEAQKAAA